MYAREIVVSPSVITTADAATSTRAPGSAKSNCQPFNLPAGGVLYIPGSDPVTLTAAAAFRPSCMPNDAPAIVAGAGGSSGAGTLSSGSLTTDGTNITGVNIDESSADSTPQYSDFRDPFYASTFPQCYALASTTVIAYTLVIMLFITPRSFLDGGVVVLGRRGFTNGGSSGKNIGGRPWLQKVAALTVAISLTIATADTFRVAERQYSWGIQNAKEMQDEVLGGTELKVIRIISDTFLWLAQAQTLIRLFPRQREKIIIKWTAFSLITLDVIFDCLNSFLYTTTNHSFTDAIPALSYLFELALGVLYAAWVIYYSLMKKRYAYYHPRMRNICLVAALSLLAILVPVVFFVLDICKPDFTGWGDYVLWVGAAAASVIVWEWVERIEALEREEKKDGILGREVFDGDEMLDVMPGDFLWPRKRRKGAGSGKDSSSGDGDERSNSRSQTGRATGRLWHSVPTFSNRYHLWPRSRAAGHAQETALHDLAQRPDDGGDARGGAGGASASDGGDGAAEVQERGGDARHLQPPLWPSRPLPAATPVSRTDTASADSTIYVMRYHPVSDSGVGSATGTAAQTQGVTLSRSSSASTTSSSSHGRAPRTAGSHISSQSESASAFAPASPIPRGGSSNTASDNHTGNSAGRWRSLTQALPFRRGPSSRSGDSEFSGASFDRTGSIATSANTRLDHEESGRWDIRARLEEFAVTQAEKLRERIRPTVDTTGLPVMVIPAPQRQGAILARVLEEEESVQAAQPRQHLEPPPAAQPQSNGGVAPMSASQSSTWAVQSLWLNNSEGSPSPSSALSRRPAGSIPPSGAPSNGLPVIVTAAVSRTGSDGRAPNSDVA